MFTDKYSEPTQNSSPFSIQLVVQAFQTIHPFGPIICPVTLRHVLEGKYCRYRLTLNGHGRFAPVTQNQHLQLLANRRLFCCVCRFLHTSMTAYHAGAFTLPFAALKGQYAAGHGSRTGLHGAWHVHGSDVLFVDVFTKNGYSNRPLLPSPPRRGRPFSVQVGFRNAKDLSEILRPSHRNPTPCSPLL